MYCMLCTARQATGDMSTNCIDSENHGLIECLKRFAKADVAELHGPGVPNKRASVAIILRIRPYKPDEAQILKHHAPEDLESLVQRDWVKHGIPEVLFIKRADRPGDRWTGHVALPGGKRELDMENDQQAAVRETLEEVGVDLEKGALYVGPLPQRIVASQFGQVPLMVLCPFLYVINHDQHVRLCIQSAEVASAHWVPISRLLSADSRCLWYEDVSNRLARQESGFRRYALRFMLGKMTFAAVRLHPSASIYDHAKPRASKEIPLFLWGLTLGVMTDFLYALPPHSALELWTYPSFTSWDLRFIMWAMAYRFRSNKARLLHGSSHDEATFVGSMTSINAVDFMLDGYYSILRKAINVSLLLKVIAGTGVLWWSFRRSRALTL